MGKQRIEKPQLWMVWPSDRLVLPVEPHRPPPYCIRSYRPGDEATFLALMAKTDFDPWDDQKLAYNMGRVIPDGWFFAVESESENVVGTVMCLHNYSGNAPFTGDVGWLACDPKHRGHGLGYALTARAVTRFVQAGYARIQLHTEYYRLPAIKTYLKLGFLPVLDSPEIHSLWAEVCRLLDWAFAPDIWPHHA
jgi:mycothiol synthase